MVRARRGIDRRLAVADQDDARGGDGGSLCGIARELYAPDPG
jgi:hypothetical protein